MGPFEGELAAFQEFFFGGQKVFYIKNEKNYLPDLSHDARKSFSENETNETNEKIFFKLDKIYVDEF